MQWERQRLAAPPVPAQEQPLWPNLPTMHFLPAGDSNPAAAKKDSRYSREIRARRRPGRARGGLLEDERILQRRE